MKRCCTCHRQKLESAFNKHRHEPDGLQPRCRACYRRYYLENKESHKAAVARTRHKRYYELKNRITEIKSQRGCALCGEKHPAALTFHHRSKQDKIIEIGRLASLGWKWNRVEKEIKKCDVLCFNCHYKLHYNERVAGVN